MKGMSEDEIARLANRLAMLVSDDGEADNAGRAVGQLARRLGLSGGQLKAIFMAGMEAGNAQSAKVLAQATRIRELEEELAETQEGRRRAEHVARAAQRDRDVLRQEVEELHARRDRRRTSTQVRWAVGLVVLAGLVGGGWLALRSPALRLIDRQTLAAGSPFYRSGIVHEQNVALRKEPDSASPALAMLTEGTHVTVKRTLWHNLEQWVEVEYAGQTGYVLGTEINLS